MNATVSAPVRDRHAARFLRHGLEMAIAMVLGMVAYVTAVGLAYGNVEDARLAQPELYAVGMAAAMCIPMVGWMRRRGHGWRACNEMTGAMVLPYLAFIVAYWLGGLKAGAICPLGCAMMVPAMLAAMLYRLDEYA